MVIVAVSVGGLLGHWGWAQEAWIGPSALSCPPSNFSSRTLGDPADLHVTITQAQLGVNGQDGSFNCFPFDHCTWELEFTFYNMPAGVTTAYIDPTSCLASARVHSTGGGAWVPIVHLIGGHCNSTCSWEVYFFPSDDQSKPKVVVGTFGGGCQDSCRLCGCRHAAPCLTTLCWSGLSRTVSTCFQHRVSPAHRSGRRARAAA